jgi:hypothetical protein
MHSKLKMHSKLERIARSLRIDSVCDIHDCYLASAFGCHASFSRKAKPKDVSRLARKGGSQKSGIQHNRSQGSRLSK